MKNVARGFLVAALLLGGSGAFADDEKPTESDADAARCAELAAQVARLETENKKLREANKNASASLERSMKSIVALTNSLTAARQMMETMTPQLESVPSGPLVAKLRERIEGWHEYYRKLIAKIGEPAVKPLLAVLRADPDKEIPWIAPVLGRIGPDAAQAVPFLKRIVADERRRQSGVARFAEEALAKITPSKASVAEAQLSQFGAAMNNYRLANKKLPDSLEALTEAGGRNPRPFLASIPDDPWGNPYEYRILDRTTYQLRSNGADGIPDTEDDIVYPRVGK